MVEEDEQVIRLSSPDPFFQEDEQVIRLSSPDPFFLTRHIFDFTKEIKDETK